MAIYRIAICSGVRGMSRHVSRNALSGNNCLLMSLWRRASMDRSDQEILDDIERRNDIRREAFLPLLQVENEFSRIKGLKEDSERARKFKEFSEPLKQRVRERVLARMRRERGDPNWNPTGVLSGGGLLFSTLVNARLRKLYKHLGSLIHE